MSRYNSIAYILQDAPPTVQSIAGSTLARMVFTAWRHLPFAELEQKIAEITVSKSLREYKGALPEGYIEEMGAYHGAFFDENGVFVEGGLLIKSRTLWKEWRPAYDIRGNCIYTNFAGTVHLSYYTLPEDEYGLPLVPEDAAEAVRYFIMWKHYEGLMETDINQFGALAQNFKKEFGASADRYRGIVNRPNASKRKGIVEHLNDRRGEWRGR